MTNPSTLSGTNKWTCHCSCTFPGHLLLWWLHPKKPCGLCQLCSCGCWSCMSTSSFYKMLFLSRPLDVGGACWRSIHTTILLLTFSAMIFFRRSKPATAFLRCKLCSISSAFVSSSINSGFLIFMVCITLLASVSVWFVELQLRKVHCQNVVIIISVYTYNDESLHLCPATACWVISCVSNGWLQQRNS